GDASTGPNHPRRHGEHADRHRPNDVERQPRHPHVGAPNLTLDRPTEQRRRWPGVLRPGVPRAAGVRRRLETVIGDPAVERHAEHRTAEWVNLRRAPEAPEQSTTVANGYRSGSGTDRA